VAGMHLEKDLTGDKDSWEKAFNEKNIFVEIAKKGLGFVRQRFLCWDSYFFSYIGCI
jgi:cobalamin biosynthesis Co2+ chelatase CbiK